MKKASWLLFVAMLFLSAEGCKPSTGSGAQRTDDHVEARAALEIKLASEKIARGKDVLLAVQLHREIDAENHAAWLVREVPIRDAAVAALRASFAADERAHPSWVVRADVVNRMRANLAMEPEVRVEPGTCYTVVARASDGLKRVDLSLHRSTPFVPSWPPSSEGLLGMASGAPEVTLTRCANPNDPAVLHVRVGAGIGEGYLMARVYAHPPSTL